MYIRGIEDVLSFDHRSYVYEEIVYGIIIIVENMPHGNHIITNIYSKFSIKSSQHEDDVESFG